MSVLIKDEGFQFDDLLGAVFVPLEGFSPSDRLLDLPNDTEASTVVPLFGQLDAIRIPFSSFSDGRGFSLARRLRSSGYTGRLRAYGHLISDQYFHARRCGFDEVEIEDPQSIRQPKIEWMAQSNWDRETYQDRLMRTG